MVAELQGFWSHITEEKDYKSGARIQSLGNHFGPTGHDYTWDWLVLGAFKEGKKSYSGRKLHPDEWGEICERLWKYSEAAFGTMVLMGKEIDALIPKMELEGINHRANRKARSLSRSLSRFEEYVFSYYDGVLAVPSPWTREMHDARPVVDVLSPKEMKDLQLLMYRVAADSYWLYAMTLRVHRAESLSSRLFRWSDFVVSRASLFLGPKFTRLRGWIAWDRWYLTKDRWRRWKIVPVTVEVRVRRKHVLQALRDSQAYDARLKQVDYSPEIRGAALTFKCRAGAAGTLVSALYRYSPEAADVGDGV